MTRMLTAGATLLLGILLLGGTALLAWRTPAPAQTARPIPDFLRVGQCYKIAFTINSAPSYKVLELRDDGWFKAEVDAGSAKAQRQWFWVNVAHIVRVTDRPCGE
jgi:hypothetical protein